MPPELVQMSEENRQTYLPPRKLLVPTDRTAFRPLNTWAGDLLSELGVYAITVGEWERRGFSLGVIFNQAALINFHTGSFDVAEQLCHKQLFWLSQAFRLTRNVHFMELASQPWINRCRLERRAGNVSRSSERLRDALHSTCGNLNPFDDTEVSRQELDEMHKRNHAFRGDIVRLCFRELILTQFTVGNYVDALELVMDPALADYIPKIMVLDTMSLVLCLLRAPDQAIEVLRYHQADSETWQKTLVSTRTVEALLMLGHYAEIETLAAKLLQFVLTDIDQTVVPSEVDLYRHLASLIEYLEHREQSCLLAASCYASYIRLDDELGAFYAAQISRRCAMDPNETTRWSNVISQMAASSSYSAIREPHGCRLLQEADETNNIRQLNHILLSEE